MENYSKNSEQPLVKERSRREFLKESAVAVLSGILVGNSGKAANALERFVNKDVGKRGPEFSFNFFFAPHGYTADLRGFSEKLKKADVFAPESLGWTDKMYKDYSSIAAGNMTPEEYFGSKIGLPARKNKQEETYEQGLIREFYNSKVRLEFFDVPQEEPLFDDIKTGLWPLTHFDEQKSIEELIDDMKKNTKKFSDLQVKREEYILSGVEDFKKRVREGFVPGMEGKKKINTLFSYGTAHSGLYRELYKNGGEVFRSYPMTPFTFTNFTEMTRRYMMGREVDDDLALRALLENVSVQGFFFLFPSFNTSLKFAYMRKAVAFLSRKEVEGLFRKITTGWPDRTAVAGFIKEVLEEKGIIVPKTEEELQKIIESSKFKKSL